MYASASPWFAITGLAIMLVIIVAIVLADYRWHDHGDDPTAVRRQRRLRHHWPPRHHIRHGH